MASASKRKLCMCHPGAAAVAASCGRTVGAEDAVRLREASVRRELEFELAAEIAADGPADAAAELEGAIKKEVERFISVGEWNMQDLSLLLRNVLLLGGSLTPAASLLPVRMLVSIYGSSLASELGERLVQEIASSLQQRLSQGLSDSVRAGGQLSKQAVSQITGKEDYEFGDITKSIGKKLFGGKGIF